MHSTAQINLRGTDFWLTFGMNAIATNTQGSEQSLQIRIVGSEQATIEFLFFTDTVNTRLCRCVAAKTLTEKMRLQLLKLCVICSCLFILVCKDTVFINHKTATRC